MSQNGQRYSRREIARLLKVKEVELMQGERGAVVEFIERQHGGLDRETCNKWIALGAPVPSSRAGSHSRMDYGPLLATGRVKGLDVR